MIIYKLFAINTFQYFLLCISLKDKLYKDFIPIPCIMKPKTREKKKFKKFLITLIILFVLVVGLYLFADWFSKTTGYSIDAEEKTKLAQCLSGKGVEFYCSESLSDCEKQKDILDTAFKYISYIDCGEDKALCPNVKEIPAWYIKKDFVFGVKSIKELRELSGCE